MSWKRLFGTATSVVLIALGVAAAPSDATPHTLVAAPPDISVANIQAHLTQLNTIASQNGGHRRAGSSGHTASVAYVKAKLSAVGYQVTEQNCGSCTYSSNNLIADWPGGPSDQVIMFGAHLDSVSAGPGINDNGSGSATILEVALALAQQNPAMAKHVRFAWWTGEEQGLEGSDHYVRNLSSTARSAIKAYYNFDMVASPNGGYFINNIDTAVSAPMKAYWDSLNLQPENDEEGVGRSDDYPFSRYGIPTSAYASGADWTKTSAQASKWGGTAGAAYDSCYHRACDTTNNINATILNNSADGVAYTLWTTAVGSTNPGNDFSVSLSPGSGTVQPGSTTSFTVKTTTTSGSAQQVSLSATGAPAGVTVSLSPQSIQSGQSATATVTASATASAGTFPITVTAQGEATHTATFTLSVGGGGGCTPAQLITNGGFESGSAPWTATSGVITSAGSGQPAHAGSALAWLNGYGRAHTDSLAQTISVPAGCGATLTYYLHIDTDEDAGSTQYDRLTLTAGGATLATYSNVDAASGYQQRTVDLSSFAGKTITLKWTGVEDAYLQTSFVLDDVAVQTG